MPAALFLEPTGAENLNVIHAADSHLALKTMPRVGGLALFIANTKPWVSAQLGIKGKDKLTHKKKKKTIMELFGSRENSQ